jgi:hypothetical protein
MLNVNRALAKAKTETIFSAGRLTLVQGWQSNELAIIRDVP